MEYIRRIVDDVIDKRTEAFNAVSITGPKGCGKTRTAKERCKTVIEFQDEDKRDGYIAVAETAPKLFLKNPKPILFDEWQDAVKIWGTIRKACDDSPEKVGEYYLTGSASKKISTPHTGTGRTAGFNENWKVKNIYDLAGNVWEWTSEAYSSISISRGGSYDYGGSDFPVSCRDRDSASGANGVTGFRLRLYIK